MGKLQLSMRQLMMMATRPLNIQILPALKEDRITPTSPSSLSTVSIANSTSGARDTKKKSTRTKLPAWEMKSCSTSLMQRFLRTWFWSPIANTIPTSSWSQTLNAIILISKSCLAWVPLRSPLWKTASTSSSTQSIRQGYGRIVRIWPRKSGTSSTRPSTCLYECLRRSTRSTLRLSELLTSTPRGEGHRVVEERAAEVGLPPLRQARATTLAVTHISPRRLSSSTQMLHVQRLPSSTVSEKR